MKGPGFLILTGIGLLLWWEPGLVGLRVGAVAIHGRRHLSSAVADSVAASHKGCTMGISTCRSLERAFRRLGIVETAQVTRVWPDTLRLVIQEERLVAQARENEDRVSFDRFGNQYRHLESVSESLPDLLGWSKNTHAAWSQAFDVLATVKSAHPVMLSGARVSGPPVDDSLPLRTQGRGLTVLLPCPADQGLKDRLEYLPVVLADARSNGESPCTADLRWTNQIVLGFSETSGQQ